MNVLQNIFSAEFIEAIGWTIVHSLWQGALIVIVLAVLMLLMRRNSAQLKYFISFIALLLIMGWSAFTFVNSFSYAKEKTALKASITADPGYIKALLSENLNEELLVGDEEKEVINIKMVKIRSFFQRNFNLICTIWIIGMLILMIKMIGGFIYARRLRTYQIIDIDNEYLKKIEQFTKKLNIKRKVRAFFSPLVKGPITLGTIKPVLLFPIAAFTGLSTKDIEAILAHELAHVLRHDYFFNIIQSIVEILFFYHPAVWLISTQIRNERENSCDNIAIELTGDKIAYVKALAQVQLNQMEQGQLAMAFASSRGSILQRIKRLQKQVVMKTNFIEGLIAAGVIVIGLSLVSFTIGNNVHPQLLADENYNQASANDAENYLAEVPFERAWTDSEIDSVRESMEENIYRVEELDHASEELEKVIEVALSENNGEISAEIMEEINEALEEMDIRELIEDAMREVEIALDDIDMEEIMEDVKADIDFDEINEDMKEARHEIEEARREVRREMRRDMEDDDVPEEIIELSIKAAEAGLDIASSVVENLPLDEIIDAALSGVGVALEAIEDIDFNEIVEEINHDLKDEISEEDLEKLKEQLEQKEKEIKEAQEKIKVKEKELKKKSKEK